MNTINIEDELKFVDPQQIELKLNSFGDLELHLSDGTVHTPVVPARSFPLTDVTHYIAIQTDDKEREEICLIEDMEQLNGESQRVLEDALEKVYFMPVISRLQAIHRRFGVTQWEVETDRGIIVFDLSTRSAISQFDDGRLLVKDVDGNRYEISNYLQLDLKSIALIETQV